MKEEVEHIAPVDSTKIDTVCIVGAGPSGLAAAR